MLLAILDVEKAYDKVWRNGLMAKLESLGTPSKLTKMIFRFLQDRTFSVRVGNALSSVRVAAEGLPQGSALSPTLFNVYVHDMPQPSGAGAKVLQFADDTALLVSGWGVDNVQTKMSKELATLDLWMRKWRLQINHDKTKIVNLGRRRYIDGGVRFRGNSVKVDHHGRYLGIIVEYGRRWKRHVLARRQLTGRTLRKLYPLMKRGSGLSKANKLRLAKAIVEAQLLYGCELWADQDPADARSIEGRRMRTIRWATEAHHLTRNEEIARRTGTRKVDDIAKERREKRIQALRNHPDPRIAQIWTTEEIEEIRERR